MSEMLCAPVLEGPGGTNGKTNEEVRTQVWALVGGLYPEHKALERRRDTRFPCPHLIHLIPLTADGVAAPEEEIIVVGKYISEGGLGFYHLEPLPYRRMIATVETGNGHWLGFLLELNWCRFTRHGWYESGGRFLRTAVAPGNTS